MFSAYKNSIRLKIQVWDSLVPSDYKKELRSKGKGCGYKWSGPRINLDKKEY
jgi:hypothetical protein